MEDDDSSKSVTVEPIENLLRRKYVIQENQESKTSSGHLIPLPQAEEPLIDMFEDENYVKIFLQCHCKGKDVKIHTDIDNTEILVEECRKLTLPVRNLNIENMAVTCNNNTILEIAIPKIKVTSGYSN
jgi:hypothetical protein